MLCDSQAELQSARQITHGVPFSGSVPVAHAAGGFIPLFKQPLEQTDMTHVWLTAHGLLHAPQLFLSLVVLISQPSGYCPSQSANPALQVATRHIPAPHLVDATFAVLGQVLPHAPQLLGSVWVFDSQPLAYMLSQLEKPLRQAVIVHLDIEQPIVAFATWAHLALQPPQLLMSDEVFASQPLRSLPSQLEKPGLHMAMTHLPAMHAACALARLQTLPQPPQLLTSEAMLISHPSPICLLQSAKPITQPVTTQPPFMQATTAFCAAHDLPHIPQFLMSDDRFASHPSFGIMLQSMKPGLQFAMAQLEFMQVHTALPPEHALPHMPQFARSVVVSEQTPTQQV